MADNSEVSVEQTAPDIEQLAGNGETQSTEPNANGEAEVKADIKPEDEESKEDKAQEEGGLINATENNDL